MLRSKFSAIAEARGDGLHPRLKELLDRERPNVPQRRADGMLQSGPNPASEVVVRPSARIASMFGQGRARPREKSDVQS
jgi:hypothetical protein